MYVIDRPFNASLIPVMMSSWVASIRTYSSRIESYLCSSIAGGFGVAVGGPLAWGLCYNHEMAPDQGYCDDSYTQYPCVKGVEYYGRGAIPVYW
jgi:hypothetical protein